MYKIALMIDCVFATSTPRRGKLWISDDHINLEYLGGHKSYDFSNMDTVKIEKFLFMNFCITIKLSEIASNRGIVSFCCYGHTNEIYELIRAIKKRAIRLQKSDSSLIL